MAQNFSGDGCPSSGVKTEPPMAPIEEMGKPGSMPGDVYIGERWFPCVRNCSVSGNRCSVLIAYQRGEDMVCDHAGFCMTSDWIGNLTKRKRGGFGPEFSSDDAGDGKNTRNVRRQSDVDREQNRKINSLERKRGGGGSGSSKSTRQKSNPPKQSNQSKGKASGGKTNVTAGNPLVQNVVAQLDVSKAQSGFPSGLVDARPSQKFTVRGQTSVSVQTNKDCVVFIAPNAANDSTRPTLAACVISTASASDATSTFTSSTAAVEPAGVVTTTLVTPTVYPHATLDDGDMHWRCLGAKLRVSYVGPDTNRSGVLKFMDDLQGQIMSSSEASTLTYSAIKSKIDSTSLALRNNFNYRSSFEYNIAGSDHRSATLGAWSQSFAALSGNWDEARLGGTTSTKLMGQPAAYLYFTNGAGVDIQLDLEIIEVWEYRGHEISALHTPSTAHGTVASAVTSVCQAAREHHAKSPNSTFSNVLKEVVKTAHNKDAMRGVEDVMKVALSLI